MTAAATLALSSFALDEARTERPGNAGQVAAVPEASAAAVADADDGPLLMSVLSDSHAYNTGSWWRQTVATGTFPGIYLGTTASQPGAASTSLVPLLDQATATGGAVVVQVGTNDLLSGRTPAQAVDGIAALWEGVRDRGAEPVAALVPPSDEVPEEVLALNEAIRDAATAEDVPLLDVYSTVADADGSWADGLTVDRRHANDAGSDLMAQAAREQLPAVIAALGD
ncbi:SGNH/GDSL hydrolase family protein [Clavibacter michiganensis subsp. insidiosus]|uniref:Esterase n=2 Tax=Clavibacter michiganensis subsp. insidiosus TaxID=33014 RepID=A0A0D5CJT6_9MICO|nr:esterase [Clavibacter michiganensis subsp. insidiosus]AWF97474.1 esterase [Clavibacter michiganensis subsp. insidiosus]AWG02435.1 esterase [Clavibacter michiganensis subsp. insidiosus]OQJ59119.1 esterase [Clavibacter michiganensis subsp. insidiosus]RII85882.1 SGNH/GDSL hydrolase family protein [Clavibacter michiganensis subsp. insidiosus]